MITYKFNELIVHANGLHACLITFGHHSQPNPLKRHIVHTSRAKFKIQMRRGLDQVFSLFHSRERHFAVNEQCTKLSWHGGRSMTCTPSDAPSVPGPNKQNMEGPVSALRHATTRTNKT